MLTAAFTGLLSDTMARLYAAPVGLGSSNPAISSVSHAAGQLAGTGFADKKVEKHACKGQNSCKGKGGCATDGSKK